MRKITAVVVTLLVFVELLACSPFAKPGIVTTPTPTKTPKPTLTIAQSTIQLPTPTPTLTSTPLITLTPTSTPLSKPTPIPTPTQTPISGKEISGFISTNTIWTADYIYVLVGNVGIPEGVTLTIQPGTKVLFRGNYPLQVEGTLVARGTPENNILFSFDQSSDMSLPGDRPEFIGIEFVGSDGSDSVIELSEFHDVVVHTGEASPLIQYNHFYGGAIKAEGGVPVVQHNVLEEGYIDFMHPQGGDVRIMHNQVMGSSIGVSVWGFRENSIAISNNLIDGATEGLRVCTRGGEKIQITQNTFRGNDHAIMLCPGRSLEMSVDIRITGNNFIASTYHHIYTHKYITSDIIATENWWGTTYESEIQGLIYDYHHDLTLPKVIYKPYATAPIPGAP